MKYLYNTTTYTRTDTSVPFYELTDEDNAVFQKYIDRGLMAEIIDTISDDGLVRSRTLVWYIPSFPIDSMLVNQLIRSDVDLYDVYVKIGQYCNEHNIIRSDTYIKVIQADQSVVHESYIMSEFLF